MTTARRRRKRIDRQTILLFRGVVVAALLIGDFVIAPVPKGGSIPTDELIGLCGVMLAIDGYTLALACAASNSRVRLLRINTA
jgi:hypothetical protein